MRWIRAPWEKRKRKRFERKDPTELKAPTARASKWSCGKVHMPQRLWNRTTAPLAAVCVTFQVTVRIKGLKRTALTREEEQRSCLWGHPMDSLTLKRDTSVNIGKERTPVSGSNKAVGGLPM